MPKSFARRIAILGGISFVNWINLQFALSTRFHMQEMSGSVALATNDVLATGRRLNTQTYAAYTAGAGWSNSAAQLALHTAGSVATLAHAGILAVSKTYEVVTIISGRTAGSVILTGTGAVSMTADNTYTDNITALGTAAVYTPSTDFDGKIDCATVTLKQTNIAASTDFPGAEELTDGNMEAATTAAYSAAASATLSKETGTRTGGTGTKVLRITRNGVNNPGANQTNVATVGKRFRFTGWARSDGTTTPRVINISVLWTGTTSTDWQYFDVEFISQNLTVIFSVTGATLDTHYAEYDDASIKPANPFNATNTALTVGVASASSKVGFLYSGNATTAVLNRYSTEYNSKWTPDNLGVLMVAQVDTWAAGIDVLYRDGVDASNEVYILRSGADLTWTYEVGGVASTVTLTNAEAVLGNAEFTIGLSADVAGVGLQAILNGAQVGTDQAIGSAIVGNLDSTMVVVFANASTAGNSWAGDGSRLILAHRTPLLSEHSDYHQRSGL